MRAHPSSCVVADLARVERHIATPNKNTTTALQPRKQRDQLPNVVGPTWGVGASIQGNRCWLWGCTHFVYSAVMDVAAIKSDRAALNIDAARATLRAVRSREVVLVAARFHDTQKAFTKGEGDGTSS